MQFLVRCVDIIIRKTKSVNGDQEIGRGHKHVDDAAERLDTLFAAAGVSEHYEQHCSPAGHRLYADLIWPFVSKALAS